MSQYGSTLQVLRGSPFFFDTDQPATASASESRESFVGRRAEILEEVALALEASDRGVTNIQAVLARTRIPPHEIQHLFGSFGGLLNALVDALAQALLAPLQDASPADEAFLPTLVAFGARVTDPRMAMQLRALYRIAIADTVRDARLGQDFYQRGPGKVLQGLARFIDAAQLSGTALTGDSRQLASHLMALLKGYAGLPDGGPRLPTDDARTRAEVSRIVGMFCQGIQQEPGHAPAAR